MVTSERTFARSLPGIHAILLCVLGLAALLVYSNNFKAEFVYDDYPFIVDNPAVRSFSNPGRFFLNREAFSEKGQYVIYRPLATLSFALNYRFSGYDPTSYHTVNILLHLACGFALYFFLHATFGDVALAFFASLFFLLHPVQTEAVSWISARGNPMFLLFLLFSIACYRKWTVGQTNRPLLYGLGLLFAVFSLLSKEMAVVLPVLLMVYDVSLNRPEVRKEWRGRFLAIVPFVALSIVYVVVRHLVLGETRQIGYWGGSLATALLTMTRGFAYYIRLLFLPRPLMVEYVMPVAKSLFQPTVLISLLVLAFIFMVAALSYKRMPIMFFGIAWFLASLLPVSNIVPLKALINERFLYLPSIGFCTLLASPVLAGRSVSRKGIVHGIHAALVMIAMCYGALTFDRNQDWRDSLSLWTASVKDSPAGATSRYNLGLELYKRGRYDEAIEHLKIALLLQERFPSAHGVLGSVYFARGEYDAAIAEYEVGLRQAADDARMKHNLAVAWFTKGKVHADRDAVDIAVKSFLKALDYEPGFSPAVEALQALRINVEPEHPEMRDISQ